MFTTLEGKIQREQQELPPTHDYKVGQTVPVLEHSSCVGLRGTVQTDRAILCTKCNRPVYADNQQFQREVSTHQRP